MARTGSNSKSGKRKASQPDDTALKIARAFLAPVVGTQIAWDTAEILMRKTEEANGLHIYNLGMQVADLDGRRGRVMKRHALSAEIQWDDGQLETVDQFNKAISILI